MCLGTCLLSKTKMSMGEKTQSMDESTTLKVWAYNKGLEPNAWNMSTTSFWHLCQK